jgi:hypothetical protein
VVLGALQCWACSAGWFSVSTGLPVCLSHMLSSACDSKRVDLVFVKVLSGRHCAGSEFTAGTAAPKG